MPLSQLSDPVTAAARAVVEAWRAGKPETPESIRMLELETALERAVAAARPSERSV